MHTHSPHTTESSRARCTHTHLVTQLEVAEHDGDLGASEREDEENKRQEAEDIVEALEVSGSHVMGLGGHAIRFGWGGARWEVGWR